MAMGRVSLGASRSFESHLRPFRRVQDRLPCPSAPPLPCGLNLTDRPRTDLESKRERARSTPIRTGAADEELHPLEHVRNWFTYGAPQPRRGNSTSLDVP